VSRTESAQKNDYRERVSALPHHLPDNHRCLIKACESLIYHDGHTFYSLCLMHLQELNMGPFKPTNQSGIGGKGEDTASLIFNHIFNKEGTFKDEG
jgi:hypothetical protein